MLSDDPVDLRGRTEVGRLGATYVSDKSSIGCCSPWDRCLLVGKHGCLRSVTPLSVSGTAREDCSGLMAKGRSSTRRLGTARACGAIPCSRNTSSAGFDGRLASSQGTRRRRGNDGSSWFVVPGPQWPREHATEAVPQGFDAAGTATTTPLPEAEQLPPERANAQPDGDVHDADHGAHSPPRSQGDIAGAEENRGRRGAVVGHAAEQIAEERQDESRQKRWGSDRQRHGRGRPRTWSSHGPCCWRRNSDCRSRPS